LVCNTATLQILRRGEKLRVLRQGITEDQPSGLAFLVFKVHQVALAFGIFGTAGDRALVDGEGFGEQIV
jgi:hypothetical protein